ncbi:MAG: EamA family transporter [Deltaproteobacteria bacterium]|nr:EamA family transporter [Deltaproteobacteria bacterium]
MVKTTLTLFLALICAGIGNIALSKGMNQVGALEIWQIIPLFHYFSSAILNPWVILGIIMELAYFLLWLVVLSWADLSWALPMHAVEYIFVALLAFFLLGESINFERWVGIVLITAGVMFVAKSWNNETKETDNELPDKDEYPAG